MTQCTQTALLASLHSGQPADSQQPSQVGLASDACIVVRGAQVMQRTHIALLLPACTMDSQQTTGRREN